MIARESLSPVCSPSLASGAPAIRVPGDLRHVRLMHDTPREAWRHWCDQARIDGLELDAGAPFNDASLALQAAVEGQGVALG
jgi:LysR family glycine cleavage system transcriptional activator